MRYKGSITGGLVLILIGVALTIEMFLPGAWALIPIGFGVVFMLAAGIHRVGGLAIPGAILSMVGAMLLWQSWSGWWSSWLYLWPLVPGALGVGFVMGNLLGMGGTKVRTLGLVWMAEAGVGKKLVRIGLQDRYAHGASRPYLMKEYGLDATALVRAVEQLTGDSLGLTEDDLRAVRLDPAGGHTKAEDL